MYTIYHIPGIKVGCSKRVEARVKSQGYINYEILEVCNTIEQASEREIYWQYKLNYGRDTTSSYSNTLEKVKLAVVPEIIKKRAETRKTNECKNKFRETINNSELWKKGRVTIAESKFKLIDQYDLEGNFIKRWNSIKEAIEALRINRSRLNKHLSNHKWAKQCGGFIWKYVNP